MDVCKRAEELVRVQLGLENWHDRLHLVEVARCSVHCLWHIFEHKVEVDLVLLWLTRSAEARQGDRGAGSFTYAIAIVVEEGFELDYVGVAHNAHDLKFTVLARVSPGMLAGGDTSHGRPTLKRLSCSTRLMAASSPLGDSLVWNTTPKEPLPTILHCVYARSL